MRHLTLFSTGGTIEKTYDETAGLLVNRASVVRRMLRSLRLESTSVFTHELLSKDSLDLTDEDRTVIVDAVRRVCGTLDEPAESDGVIVLHGTDTLSVTGEALYHGIPNPGVPIVLTGAMRPYEMKASDALQNLTEAVFATGVLTPGVWCVAHGRALPFPGVTKDRKRGTFVRIAAGQALPN